MVEAAKQCASNPSDPESQQTLKTAAENLRSTTHAAVGTTIKRKMIKRLENASKHAAATATQCIAASQGAGGHNTNGMSQDELMESCKAVADVIPRLVLVLIFLDTNISCSLNPLTNSDIANLNFRKWQVGKFWQNRRRRWVETACRITTCPSRFR